MSESLVANRLTDKERDEIRAYFAGILRDRKRFLAADNEISEDLVRWCDGRMDGVIGLLVFWPPKLDPDLALELLKLKTGDYFASVGWHGPGSEEYL